MIKNYLSYIKENNSEFHIGDTLLHNRYSSFGMGTIVFIRADGSYVIEFENRTGLTREGAKPEHGFMITKSSLLEFCTIIENPKYEPKIKWYKNGKLEESVKPFTDIKDYGIKNVIETHNDDIEIELVTPFHTYNLYDGDGTATFSQYKKYLNNKLVGKLVFFVYERDDESYITKRKISGVGTDGTGYITSLIDKNKIRYPFLHAYSIIDVNKYVELLKTLIGEHIDFYRFLDKKDNEERTNNFKLKKVHIDMYNDICFTNDEGVTYVVNPYNPIKKPAIFSPEDPYGEEDWDD